MEMLINFPDRRIPATDQLTKLIEQPRLTAKYAEIIKSWAKLQASCYIR
jgi:hypothetical protein